MRYKSCLRRHIDMRRQIKETFENMRTVIEFAVSMAKDVRVFIREEKNYSDYLLVAEMLNLDTAN
jgi:hypothetical protein